MSWATAVLQGLVPVRIEARLLLYEMRCSGPLFRLGVNGPVLTHVRLFCPTSLIPQAVELFKDGKQPVLVATDVCARGLDIPDVEVVINYSFPLTVEVCVVRAYLVSLLISGFPPHY